MFTGNRVFLAMHNKHAIVGTMFRLGHKVVRTLVLARVMVSGFLQHCATTRLIEAVTVKPIP